MKSVALRIALRLAAYNSKDVIAGFKIWNSGVEVNLEKQGWKEQNEKPIDREYFKLAGKYWVQEITPPKINKPDQKQIDTHKKSLVKQISPLQKRSLKSKLKEFYSITSGDKVIDSIFNQRLKICSECSFKIVKEDKIYCKPCSCPTYSPAELHNKLKWSRLSCPNGYFKAIPDTENHLLIKESFIKKVVGLIAK